MKSSDEEIQIMSNKNKKGGSWKRIVLQAVCVLLAIVLVVLLSATVWLESFLGQINREEGPVETLSQEELDNILKQTDPVDPGFTGEEIKEDEITVPSQPAQLIENNEAVLNILLVGQDRREGQGRQRSDAMILCTVNKNTKTMTMTSFMRDMYVKIPGFYNQRINVAYAVGGYTALSNTLKYNFGIQTDHFVEIDFSGFEQAVDLVGGVDIELTKDEALYLNNRGNWDTNEKYDGSWKLKAGVNHLTGEQALAYSRIRNVGTGEESGDFGRTSRQRVVLGKLIEKAKTLSLTELYNLVNGLIPLITTDMTNQEIMSYVMDYVPILPDLQLVTQRIPADGTYSHKKVNGMAVILPNLEKNREILENTIG